MATERILIVDDDESFLDLLSAYLDSFGLDYETAQDGQEALEKLRKGSFSIVLTDMIMPRMDGMELLKHLRVDYSKLGVIAITGGLDFSYTHVIRAGASDFISKPFGADELEAKLNRLIRELNIIRELEKHAILDSLTNLYNRRYFDNKILDEVKRAERQGHKVFLQMIDVDNLKGYNDAFGHPGGDELLRCVSGILRKSIRENVDWVFRYGGDEFGIIITEVESPQVARIAERILESYEEENFPGTGLSIGVARFLHHTGRSWQEDITDLVARADKALYAAKGHGKNQVYFDEAVKPSG